MMRDCQRHHRRGYGPCPGCVLDAEIAERSRVIGRELARWLLTVPLEYWRPIVTDEVELD